MVTRRALFGAGAVALLAGCGPSEAPEVVPEEVLREQLERTHAVLGALEVVPETAALRQNAQDRARRIEAALGAGAGATPDAAASLEAALEAEQAALRAHVAAVGLLGEREWRELLGGLVADSAAGEAALRRLLGRPLTTAFPGEPVA